MRGWKRWWLEGIFTSSRRSRRDVLLIFGPALLVTVIGFVVAFQFVQPLPPSRIVMATGPEDGGYHRFALLYKEILARDGIELELRTSAGTFENERWLVEPEGDIEIAFLQGGAGSKKELTGIQSLGSVFYEPVWIFSRGPSPETVRDLLGKRVAIGEPQSGTQIALITLFELNGVPLDQASTVDLGGEAAVEGLVSGELDAACFVATQEAWYVRRLLTTPGVEPMSFDRADAYMRRYRFLSRVVLPRGVVDLEHDLPPADVPLIAMVANIAARETLHPALVGVLLAAATEVHGGGDILAVPDKFPSTYNVVLPLNKEALRYLKKGPPFLQRYLPFWIAIGIDRLVVLLIPFATLLYPLFKIVPPTYRWRVRSRIYRHYRNLLAVDARLKIDPPPEDLEEYAAHLGSMESELTSLIVPPAYADLLYHLEIHLKVVQQRVDAARVGALQNAERGEGGE